MLPNVPSADNLSVGFEVACVPFEWPGKASVGGMPTKVNLSHDESNSESASRSQEDCRDRHMRSQVNTKDCY